MIDSSIPFRAGTAGAFSLADLAQQSQQMQLGQRAADQRDRALDQQSQQIAVQIQENMAKLDRASLEQQGKRWAAAAPLIARMKTMPYDQRRPFLLQAAPALLAQGWTQEELAAFDPTDATVDSLGTAAMTVAQVLDSQKITWHQVGERGSFAVDNMGNPTGEGNPFVPGAQTAGPPPPPGFVVDGGPTPPASGAFPVGL